MERFGALIREDFKRIETIKNAPARKDFKKLSHITVGILPGDGIGPYIMEQALRVAKYLLAEEVAEGKVGIPDHPGHDHRRTGQKNESLPPEVLEACKACDVLVKGPFVTPRASDPWPNMVSANSLLRRAPAAVCRCTAGADPPKRASTGRSSGRTSKGNTSGATRASR